MTAIESVPEFEGNFERFLSYLRDKEVSAVSISPKRYGMVMHIDIQTLATKARVHRNTISRAPETETVQNFLRESIRVIRAAVDISDSIEGAIFWFKNNPIPAFDYKTAENLVSEGKTENLIKYIQSLQAGFLG